MLGGKCIFLTRVSTEGKVQVYKGSWLCEAECIFILGGSYSPQMNFQVYNGRSHGKCE
ncbi:MAG: hypothetical protein ACI8QT_001377 [Halioglobus sp.]|jgi:hypothetical protein